MAELHAYRVGALYSPGRTRYPEGAEYNYRQHAHELRLFFASPSKREVEAVKDGDVEFALHVAQPLVVLLYRFGGAIPWSDSPFTIHLVPPDQRTLPEPADVAEPHDLLTTLLVDAATGIIRAIRVVSLSPAFTVALRLAIREQAGQPWDPAAYDRAIAALYRRYPSSGDLLKAAQHRIAPPTP